MNQPARLPSGVEDGCVICGWALSCLGAATALEARATMRARAIEVELVGVRRHYGAPSSLYVKPFTFAKFSNRTQWRGNRSLSGHVRKPAAARARRRERSRGLQRAGS
jgi:hypothetical protein